MFKRLFDILWRNRSIGAPNTTYVPDPFKDFPNPANQELFAAMKPFYSPEQQFGCYNGHPDLEIRLDELAFPLKIIRNSLKNPVIGPFLRFLENLVDSKKH